MAQGRSRTAMQRGIRKVKKIRSIIFLLLICVAMAIFMVDRQSQGQLPIQANINPNQPIGTSTTESNISDNNDRENRSLAPPSMKPNISTSSDSIVGNSKVSNGIVPSGVIKFVLSPMKDKKSTETISGQKEARKSSYVSQKKRQISHKKLISHRKPILHNRRVRRTKFYSIAAGDSFSNLAKRYYGKASLWRVLFRINRSRVSKPSKLRVGQKIYLPSKTQLLRRTKTLRRVGPKASRGGHFRSTPTRRRRKHSSRVYYVRRGDTLQKIARKLGLSFLSLLDSNPNLKDPNSLSINTPLIIPTSLNALASHR